MKGRAAQRRRVLPKGSKNLTDLFTKPVGKEDLPRQDTRSFKRAKLARAAAAAELERRGPLDEAERDRFEAGLRASGADPDQLKQLFKNRPATPRELKKHRERMFAEHYRIGAAAPLQVDQAAAQRSAPECREITIRVCRTRRVCVDQRLNVPVSSIYLEPGSDAEFQTRGSDGFTARDFVCGYSYWDWEYRRVSVTREGQITILAALELRQETSVKSFGVELRHLFDASGSPVDNAAWAVGGQPHWPLVGSTGLVALAYRLEAQYLRPGGQLDVRPGPAVPYLVHGPVGSNVAAMPNLLIPPHDFADLSATASDLLPMGTTVIIKASLSYGIVGTGDNGMAAVAYGMRAQPYLNMEACTYEYPERVCVDLRDYLS